MKAYLTALQQLRPRRGRKRTPTTIDRQLTAVEQQMTTPVGNALTRLKLVQRRRDLQADRQRLTADVDLTEAEAKFVAAAKSYGERHGISYATWREVGVSPTVLKRAGITR